jgi:chromosome segregation ATPase
MASEALLTALNNTLNDLLTERDKINCNLDNDHTFWVTNAHQCLKSAENDEALARLKLKKIDDQLRALVAHVNGMSEQPKVLQDKISQLSNNRIEAQRKYQEAVDKIPQAKETLRTAKDRMELEKNRLNDVQKQIQEVQNQLIGPGVVISY